MPFFRFLHTAWGITMTRPVTHMKRQILSINRPDCVICIGLFFFQLPENVISFDVERDDSTLKFTVATGAEGMLGNNIIDINVLNINGEVEAIGSPYVNISLPLAESVDVSTSCSGNKITRKNDLARSVFSIKDSCQMRVTVNFPGKFIIFSKAKSQNKFFVSGKQNLY